MDSFFAHLSYMILPNIDMKVRIVRISISTYYFPTCDYPSINSNRVMMPEPEIQVRH